MLAKENRLTKDRDFRRVKKEGTVIAGPSFALALYFRDDDEPSRFGFVVSKKVDKNATKRSMIKRALSESLRHELAYVKKGYDGVFLVQPGAEKYMSDLMQETKMVIKKARLV
jgi:ribonuclease P protein component